MEEGGEREDKLLFIIFFGAKTVNGSSKVRTKKDF